jgi:hypothetical protein
MQCISNTKNSQIPLQLCCGDFSDVSEYYERSEYSEFLDIFILLIACQMLFLSGIRLCPESQNLIHFFLFATTIMTADGQILKHGFALCDMSEI